jgi:hypothetical protein
MAQSTWLVPRRGITVAGQRRNQTGFAGATPAGDMGPARGSLYPVAAAAANSATTSGRDRCERAHRQPPTWQTGIVDALGMQEVAKLAHAVGQSRRGSGEVRIAVRHNGAHGQTQPAGPRHRPLDVEGASGHHDKLGIGSEHRLPARPHRVLTGAAEDARAPTSESSSPISATMSVALGSSETIRMPRLYLARTPAPRDR